MLVTLLVVSESNSLLNALICTDSESRSALNFATTDKSLSVNPLNAAILALKRA